MKKGCVVKFSCKKKWIVWGILSILLCAWLVHNASNTFYPSSGLPYTDVIVKKYYDKLGPHKRGPGFLTMSYLAEKKAQRSHKPLLIVETGSMRQEKVDFEGDGASTMILSGLAERYKGKMYSVDLDPICKQVIAEFGSPNVEAVTGDSVTFLQTFPHPEDIDVLYLDSYDLHFQNPHPSMEHHLKEIQAVFSRLKPGTIIAVDDNQIYDGERLVPGIGKGTYVDAFLRARGVKLIHDGYQRVYQISPAAEDEFELGVYRQKLDFAHKGRMRRIGKKFERLKKFLGWD